MKVQCKSKVTATANCSRTAGGPYVDLVKGKELYLEQNHAEYLQERDKLKILSYEPEKETSDEQQSKDRLMAQAKELDDVKLTANMKLETMIGKLEKAGHEPDLGDDGKSSDDEDNGSDENKE